MIVAGVSALTGNNINFWSSEHAVCFSLVSGLIIFVVILSGGRRNVMMANCGSWIIIVLMSLLLWVVWKVSSSILCSRELISPLGRVSALCVVLVFMHLSIFFQFYRSLLGESFRLRGIYAIQKIDQCPTFRFEPDSQSSFYPLVESYNQSRERLRRFPSATWFDWYLYVSLNKWNFKHGSDVYFQAR